MARHNIYIREENEDYWEQSSKSDFINEYLSANFERTSVTDRPPYNKKHPMKQVRQKQKVELNYEPINP